MTNKEFTFHTKIESSPILKSMGTLFNKIEHCLWAGFQAKKPLKKPETLKKYGIFGRNYNSCLSKVQADIKSIKETQQTTLANLKDKINKEKKYRDDTFGSAKVNELKTKLEKLLQAKEKNPSDLKKLESKIAKVTKNLKKANNPYLLHRKTVEIEKLSKKLAALEDCIAKDHQKLTFGTNKLFRAQYHLKRMGSKTTQNGRGIGNKSVLVIFPK